MNTRCFAGALILSALVLLAPRAGAVTVNNASTCVGIGGSWVNSSAPPTIGTCTLNASYTVAANDKLGLGAGVVLRLIGYRVLHNQGELLINGTARLEIDPGYVVNDGKLVLPDNAVMDISGGYLYNRATVSNDGTINNNTPQGTTYGFGFYNTGTVDNTNDGTILSYWDGQIVNRDRSTIVNRGGLYSNSLMNVGGTIVNHTGAFLHNERSIYIDAGGLLDNRGLFENVGTGILHIIDGTLDNNAGGRTYHSGARFENHSNGSVVNRNGVLENAARLINGGQIDNQFGHFYNNSGATIDNLGRIINGCFGRFVNNGTVNNNPVEGCFIPWRFPPIPRLP